MEFVISIPGKYLALVVLGGGGCGKGRGGCVMVTLTDSFS